MPTTKTRRERIIDYLKKQGGVIKSEDGRGLTAAIAKASGYDDLPTLNGMLARLERDGIIERDIKGKRTYSITLVDETLERQRAARQPAAQRARVAARATSTDVTHEPETLFVAESNEVVKLLNDILTELKRPPKRMFRSR